MQLETRGSPVTQVGGVYEAGCLPYGQYECEELCQSPAKMPACERYEVVGNCKACTATSSCCADSCPCAKSTCACAATKKCGCCATTCACAKAAACACCAAKAKCCCAATCACAKPACACGATCACAKSACSCCNGCACGTAAKARRVVRVAVPVMPPWVSEVHGFPMMPPPPYMPPVMLPMPAQAHMPDADCVYPYPVCPMTPPPAPPVDVLRRMPGYPMPPAPPQSPPLAPVLHYERIDAPVSGPVCIEDDSVRIVAGGHAIRIHGNCFEARCERLVLQESQDTVLLEGNVQIEIRRHYQPSRIEAQRVLVNFKSGTFEVNPVAPTQSLRPVSAQPVSRPIYSAPMPTPMPQRPMPQSQVQPSRSSSAVNPNARMEELLHESEGGRQIQSQWRSFLMIEPPSYPTPIRVHGGLGP